MSPTSAIRTWPVPRNFFKMSHSPLIGAKCEPVRSNFKQAPLHNNSQRRVIAYETLKILHRPRGSRDMIKGNNVGRIQKAIPKFDWARANPSSHFSSIRQSQGGGPKYSGELLACS